MVNTISYIEEPANKIKSGGSEHEKVKISPAVKALSQGNIVLYINELMQSNRFPSNEDTGRFLSKTSREIYDLKRSRNYFSQEARSILEYSAKKLSKTPDIKTIQNCLSYVSDLLGENTPQAYEVTQIITIYLFSDAQRVHDLGFNVEGVNDNELQKLKSKKQEYTKKLQELLPHATHIEYLSINDMKALILKVELDEDMKKFYANSDFSKISDKI